MLTRSTPFFLAVLLLALPDSGESQDKEASQDKAVIVVRLPADAKLTIDGEPTKATGSERRFTASGLAAGKRYSWVLAATWTERGETKSEKTTVTFMRGETKTATLGTATEVPKDKAADKDQITGESSAKLELFVQTGHTLPVSSISLSADGGRALTGSSDGTAIVWDARTGKQLRTLRGHKSYVLDVNISPDGRRALTGAGDNAAILWDVETGKQLRSFKVDSAVRLARLSGGGTRVLTGTWDKTAVLWDARTGEKLHTLTGHTGSVYSASLSGDSKLALTGSEDKTAVLWDARTGENLHTLTGHTGSVRSVSLSEDGSRALTGSADKTAILWDARTGKQIRSFKGYRNAANCVSLSQDGRRALIGDSWGSTADLWDVETGEKVVAIDGGRLYFEGICLSNDGSRVLSKTIWGNWTRLWDAKTGKELLTLGGQTGYVSSLSQSQDGGRVLIGSGSAAVLWDLKGGEKLMSLQGHTGSVSRTSLSGDGKRALTGGEDKRAILWDTSTGEQLQTFAGNDDRALGMSLSGDASRALTSWDFNGSAILWDAKTGKQLHTLKAHQGPVWGASLSGDGSRALTGAHDHTAVVWDTITGKQLHTLKGHTLDIRGVRLSQDGNRALTGSSDYTATLWNARTGEKLVTFWGHKAGVSDVDLHQDGTRVLTGSEDGSVVLWDAKTGEKLRTFKSHSSSVKSVLLSSDSRRALTGSVDGTTRVWDTESGKELCSLISVGGKDWLVVTPDGYFDGSVNGAKLISYRVADTLEFVPLERYRQQFERPGLLAMIWKGEDYRGKASVKQELPPTARITSPKPGHVSKDGKFTITAEAESRGKLPVTTFRLKVNGKPYVKNQGLLEIESPKLGKATAAWEIELEPGRHSVEVLAYTKAVFNVSEQVEVKYVGGEVQPQVELPALYVLAVGISKYPNKDHQLDFAHRDAEEITKAYQKHGKALFKKIEVTLLTDEKATRKGILQGLTWLRKSATSKDYVVFHYAGHGVKDNRDRFYLFPVDGDRDDLTATAVDGEVISNELVSIPGQLLVLLDACHAGQVVENKTRSIRGLTEDLLKDLSSEEKGVAIMCSATGKELAQESRKHEHGLFTLALLEAIRGTGNGEKGKDEFTVRLSNDAVYFKEMDGYVTNRVRQLSKNQQHPVTGVPRTFRDFPVSKPK